MTFDDWKHAMTKFTREYVAKTNMTLEAWLKWRTQPWDNIAHEFSGCCITDFEHYLDDPDWLAWCRDIHSNGCIRVPEIRSWCKTHIKALKQLEKESDYEEVFVYQGNIDAFGICA